MQLSVKDVADNANMIINGYAYTTHMQQYHTQISYLWAFQDIQMLSKR